MQILGLWKNPAIRTMREESGQLPGTFPEVLGYGTDQSDAAGL